MVVYVGGNEGEDGVRALKQIEYLKFLSKTTYFNVQRTLIFKINKNSFHELVDYLVE